MIASLVVFIPGVALTTAFLELTEGQTVAGSSRLVRGGTQFGLLAWAGRSSATSSSAHTRAASSARW